MSCCFKTRPSSKKEEYALLLNAASGESLIDSGVGVKFLRLKSLKWSRLPRVCRECAYACEKGQRTVAVIQSGERYKTPGLTNLSLLRSRDLSVVSKRGDWRLAVDGDDL